MVNHRALALMNPRPAARPKSGDGLLRLAAFVAAVGVAAWSLSSSTSSPREEEDDEPEDPPDRPPFRPVDLLDSPGSPRSLEAGEVSDLEADT